MFLGFLGALKMWFDKKLSWSLRVSSLVLLSPLFFNILALYLGHSVIYVAGLSGETWFNVRYGVMMMPSFAIYIAYFLNQLKSSRLILISLMLFLSFFSFQGSDAVTIDDAVIGASQKNVTEVSGWLKENTENKDEFILISVASHDAIIFSSGLPMKKFIHEGAGQYYDQAIENPDKWARFIVMRTYSDDDSTWRNVKDTAGFEKFDLVDHYPFADIYELKPEFLNDLEFNLNNYDK